MTFYYDWQASAEYWRGATIEQREKKEAAQARVKELEQEVREARASYLTPEMEQLREQVEELEAIAGGAVLAGLHRRVKELEKHNQLLSESPGKVLYEALEQLRARVKELENDTIPWTRITYADYKKLQGRVKELEQVGDMDVATQAKMQRAFDAEHTKNCNLVFENHDLTDRVKVLEREKINSSSWGEMVKFRQRVKELEVLRDKLHTRIDELRQEAKEARSTYMPPGTIIQCDNLSNAELITRLNQRVKELEHDKGMEEGINEKLRARVRELASTGAGQLLYERDAARARVRELAARLKKECQTYIRIHAKQKHRIDELEELASNETYLTARVKGLEKLFSTSPWAENEQLRARVKELEAMRGWPHTVKENERLTERVKELKETLARQADYGHAGYVFRLRERLKEACAELDKLQLEKSRAKKPWVAWIW